MTTQRQIIVHNDTKERFTIIENSIFFSSLSLKAVGLLCRMFSLPREWDYSVLGLAKISNCGRDCIMSALKELEDYGYVRRERTRNEKGQMQSTQYHIYTTPQISEPLTEDTYVGLSNVGLSNVGKSDTIKYLNNKELNNINPSIHPSDPTDNNLPGSESPSVDYYKPIHGTATNPEKLSDGRTENDTDCEGATKESFRDCFNALKETTINRNYIDRAYGPYKQLLSEGYTPDEISQAFADAQTSRAQTAKHDGHYPQLKRFLESREADGCRAEIDKLRLVKLKNAKRRRIQAFNLTRAKDTTLERLVDQAMEKESEGISAEDAWRQAWDYFDSLGCPA